MRRGCRGLRSLLAGRPCSDGRMGLVELLLEVEDVVLRLGLHDGEAVGLLAQGLLQLRCFLGIGCLGTRESLPAVRNLPREVRRPVRGVGTGLQRLVQLADPGLEEAEVLGARHEVRLRGPQALNLFLDGLLLQLL
eukprot:4814148-Lingulodinium_polyedra.AAC.1